MKQEILYHAANTATLEKEKEQLKNTLLALLSVTISYISLTKKSLNQRKVKKTKTNMMMTTKLNI